MQREKRLSEAIAGLREDFRGGDTYSLARRIGSNKLDFSARCTPEVLKWKIYFQLFTQTRYKFTGFEGDRKAKHSRAGRHTR
jgi:hypothetical protein